MIQMYCTVQNEKQTYVGCKINTGTEVPTADAVCIRAEK
jgi:hypothetical protein